MRFSTKIYEADVVHHAPAVDEWLPTVDQIDQGLRGEACALERSDAPIRIGAELGREGVHGLERALDGGAVGGGL
jgi:hypothetical protein